MQRVAFDDAGNGAWGLVDSRGDRGVEGAPARVLWLRLVATRGSRGAAGWEPPVFIAARGSSMRGNATASEIRTYVPLVASSIPPYSHVRFAPSAAYGDRPLDPSFFISVHRLCWADARGRREDRSKSRRPIARQRATHRTNCAFGRAIVELLRTYVCSGLTWVAASL